MDDTLGDGFAGYNEWIIRKIKVKIVTDFVYEFQKDAYTVIARYIHC